MQSGLAIHFPLLWFPGVDDLGLMLVGWCKRGNGRVGSVSAASRRRTLARAHGLQAQQSWIGLSRARHEAALSSRFCNPRWTAQRPRSSVCLHPRRTQSYSGTPSPADVSTSTIGGHANNPREIAFDSPSSQPGPASGPLLTGGLTQQIFRYGEEEPKKKELPHDHPKPLSSSTLSFHAVLCLSAPCSTSPRRLSLRVETGSPREGMTTSAVPRPPTRQ
ncbi:hypothetical protein QBC39DRAFT_358382 [Podospora conica]|nr:hypothetical protein QBC39DRAFT_358382 [Schizothecium conicum]